MGAMPRLPFLLALMIPSAAWASPDFEASEQARIRRHLLRAETAARARATPDLSKAQRTRRAAALDALARYREAGRFPVNVDVVGRAPVFVDHRGVRCAMAELLHVTGEDALVARVAATNNLARIHDLASDEGLTRWLDHHGLTVDEAAAIQPTYRWCYDRSEAFCPFAPTTGIVRVELIDWVPDATEQRFRVTEVLSGTVAQVADEIVGRTYGTRREEVQTAVAVLLPRSSVQRVLGLRDGEVFVAEDPCDVDVSVPLEDVVSLLLAEDCVDRLERRDPVWAGRWCTTRAGPDCPVAPDAGFPSHDAGGAIDAGETSDTGVSPSVEPNGCRCTTRGRASPWALLLLVLLQARLALPRRK